jgi:hypothetical protein
LRVRKTEGANGSISDVRHVEKPFYHNDRVGTSFCSEKYVLFGHTFLAVGSGLVPLSVYGF